MGLVSAQEVKALRALRTGAEKMRAASSSSSHPAWADRLKKLKELRPKRKLAMSAGIKPPPLPEMKGQTPQQRLKKTQDIGSVGAFDQKTQGVQFQKFKPMSMMPKVSFAVSQYSGPLGPGRMNYRNPMGMPGSPPSPIKVAGPPPPGDEEGTSAQYPSKDEKRASLSRAARNAFEAFGEWQQKHAAPITPAQKLNNSRGVGAPKLSPPPGPSIQQIAKPVGFGLPAPGATKTP